MVYSGTKFKQNNNYSYDDIKYSRDIILQQLNLISETNNLVKSSFETQFLNKNTFQALCFLVICYRKFVIDDNIIEDCLNIMNIEEDALLDTIQNFFAIHEKKIPDSLIKVIKLMSNLLK
jgi:hypothetical protein